MPDWLIVVILIVAAFLLIACLVQWFEPSVKQLMDEFDVRDKEDQRIFESRLKRARGSRNDREEPDDAGR